MKSPPPVVEFYRFPVTAGVAGLAIFVTVLGAMGRNLNGLMMDPRAFEREPYRLITSALPHVGALHLIFNVAWLWAIGTLLEERFGGARLLLLMILFAAGSAAGEYAVFYGGVGLSGVVYGLYGLLWVLSRADKQLLGAADRQTTFIFAGWFIFCIIATYMNAMAVANVAHGVGAALGLLSGLAITGGIRPNQRSALIRWTSFAGAALLFALCIAGSTVLRRRFNFSGNGPSYSYLLLAKEAHLAMQYDEAVTRYRQAVAVDPKNAFAWFYLGGALVNMGDKRAGLEAIARAVELEPNNTTYSESLAEQKRALEAPFDGDGAEEP